MTSSFAVIKETECIKHFCKLVDELLSIRVMRTLCKRERMIIGLNRDALGSVSAGHQS
jgi:hypothetical protein